MAAIEEWMPEIDPRAVDDLRARLRATRWSAPPGGAPLGIAQRLVRPLVEYWADGFDFDAHAAALRALPSRRTRIDGMAIHFLHARATGSPRHTDPSIPLLLLHGWPDSAWRYRRVIAALGHPAPTDPARLDPARSGQDAADAFDLVIPDMPGYGFSDAPPGSPLNSREVAGMWAELMSRLGYERFVVSGGDIGSHVARYLALDHPDRVIAVHRTDGGYPAFADGAPPPTSAERAWIDDVARWRAAEGAYAALHRTKPDTVAVALTDSPAGLAAWILEKIEAWSDVRDGLWSVYRPDDVLQLLTETWLTGSVGASMRMYAANAALPPGQLMRRVEVASGFSLFPADILRPPREWLERSTNLVWFSEPARGGHFAAFEQPDLYVDELRTFVRAVSSS